jgi:hypothetical protein
VENGRASNLMKSSTKRKRTREELEEVKQEEEELKTDKQVFLQMVKRLKDEKAALEEQVELLSEQMMPPSANSSALGSKSMPGPFNI